MSVPAVDLEPACPALDQIPSAPSSDDAATLHVQHRPVASIPATTWDRLVAANPWSTPFSAWAFQRAWWDAYGENADDRTLVVTRGPGPEAMPIAIVPLMRRHEVEATDALTQTRMRHGTTHDLTPVAPSAAAVFFGASYHADYATILASPDDLPAATDAVARDLTDPGAEPWDVIDLRRLRCGDPTADLLALAFRQREMTDGLTLNVEREDVCPVVTIPGDTDVEGYLGGLGKKERHEIRRKVRRAEAVGPVVLEDSVDPLGDLPAFIDLHQRRWGVDGLFPATVGGDQSRRFFRRLFECFGAGGPLRLTFLSVGGRRIAAGVHFETNDGVMYYNAGVDPDARHLSPGVLMVHAYVERLSAAGKTRMDFLRGDESYKYEWGAVDEPIQRLLVRRTA